MLSRNGPEIPRLPLIQYQRALLRNSLSHLRFLMRVFLTEFAAIRVVVRGKAHTEWKVIVGGERRTVKDEQYYVDDRAIIWGKGNCSNVG